MREVRRLGLGHGYFEVERTLGCPPLIPDEQRQHRRFFGLEDSSGNQVALCAKVDDGCRGGAVERFERMVGVGSPN